MSGTNPSCPSGYQVLSKHYYGTCGGNSAICSQPYGSITCPGCSVDKWDTNPPSCTWRSAIGGQYCECSGYSTCQVNSWNAAFCVGN